VSDAIMAQMGCPLRKPVSTRAAQVERPLRIVVSALTAQVEGPLRKTVSARMAQIESPLRNGELASESDCTASTTGGTETATGGTGIEDGTGAVELAAAKASTGSGSATSSASVGSSSATGSGGLSEVCVIRTAGGRGGGFDARAAGGGAVDSVGRGGSRDGRLGGGFVAGTLAGDCEGPRTASRGTRACTAGFAGVSPRPSPKAFATSTFRMTVGSASLLLSRPMVAKYAGTLRACGGGRYHSGKQAAWWTVR
jgi:hypothetical protein